MCKEYNGYTNYETWAVALWLDNEEYSHEESRRIVNEYDNTYDASKALQEWVEEFNPLNDNNTLFADLLNAALSVVNWYEIAENYREGY